MNSSEIIRTLGGFFYSIALTTRKQPCPKCDGGMEKNESADTVLWD